jgi:hypothetical protein
MEGHQLPKDLSKKTRKRAFAMSDSEVITIMIMFHQSHYRDLKFFYINHIQAHCKSDFPHTVSYNSFVELQQKALLHLVSFLQFCCLGKCTGISHAHTGVPRQKGKIPQDFQGIGYQRKINYWLALGL